jgi:ribosomal-protein-alanine N-acetyltransferase
MEETGFSSRTGPTIRCWQKRGGRLPLKLRRRRDQGSIVRDADGFASGGLHADLLFRKRIVRRPASKEASMGTSQQQEARVHIRWMIRRDMAEVLDIENESFEFPWSEEEFIRCLRQRNCIGMVADQDDKVVGFMIYELHKTRLHVLNFAVAGKYRRQHVGTRMIAKLAAKLSQQRRTRIVLEVRETNLAAQLFFRAQQFRAVNVLRDFYEDTTEDAYLMQYRYQASEVEMPADNRTHRLAG